MKQLIIKTVCTATVFETWHVTVPNNWAFTTDGPLDAIDQFDGECVSEDVRDERDRDVLNVTVRFIHDD